MYKVFLGIGHGGTDPGAVANGFEEADLNLDVGLACRDELERHGVQVLMSRTCDEEDTVGQEVAECNTYGPDIAADIHFNAGGGDGCEIYHSVNKGVGATLARNIEVEFVALGQNSRGVRSKPNKNGTDYYAFIRETKCPAVIVECAFVDNLNDMAIADTLHERKRMGKAVARGILKMLGVAVLPAGTLPSDEEVVRSKAGLQSETMEYLKAYAYGDELLRKLAGAMK